MNPDAGNSSVNSAALEVARTIVRYLDTLPDAPPHRPYPRELREELAAQPIPVEGRPFADVLAEFREKIAPYPFGNGHPRFLAWVNSPPHPAGIAADALAAAMNPSVAGGDQAAVHIEHQVVRWFAGAAGLPAGAGGLLVSGGSSATLTALAAARHRTAARAGVDMRADGLQGDARFAVYLGAEGHGSARKAVELLGFGSAWVRTVAAGADFRMDPHHLRTLIAADRARGVHPVAVMASAGTTNTGAIDPLGEIADVCAELDVWLHVDGAYGAPALLFLDEYARHRAALSRVDSIALDPHKWLYAPVDAGLLLLRDPRLAREAFSLVPAYLRTDDEPWFSEFGFEQTRPFRALKVWFLLQHLGTRGYADLIRHDLAMAERLAAAVEAADELELLARGLSVVCFRGRPAGVRPDELDEQNRRVLAEVQKRAFLAGTTVNGVFGLRACVVNPGTTEADIDAVVDAVVAAVRAA